MPPQGRSLLCVCLAFLAFTVASSATAAPAVVSKRPLPPWKEPIPPELKARVEREAKLAFDEGETLYLAGRYDDAYRVWQAVIANFPGTQGRALAHRCTAQYWKNIKRQLGLALQEYDKAIALDPDGQIGRDALFGKAHCLYLLGDFKTSHQILTHLQRLGIGGDLGNNIGRWRMRAWAKYSERAKWQARGIRLPERARVDCGPAALSVVCNRLGVKASREEIRKLSKMAPQGASLLDLKRAAEAKGMKATGLVANQAKLQQLAKARPVVAHVAGNHFVAVVQAGKKGVDYIDGDYGRIHLDWDQWKMVWKGALLAVEPPTGTKRPKVASAARTGDL